MLKLISLEYKKNNASRFILYEAVCIAFALILAFMMDFTNLAAVDGDILPFDTIVKTTTGIISLVMAGVMHAAFTVSEYKRKTIDLMFSYPISRKKILTAKILAVLFFNFAAVIVAQVVMYVFFIVTSQFIEPAAPAGFDLGSVQFYISLLFNSIMMVSISMIALYVGMLKKSTVSTVVSSFVLMTLLQGNFGSFTLADSVLLLIVLTAVSVIFMLIMIGGIEKKDVL